MRTAVGLVRVADVSVPLSYLVGVGHVWFMATADDGKSWNLKLPGVTWIFGRVADESVPLLTERAWPKRESGAAVHRCAYLYLVVPFLRLVIVGKSEIASLRGR